MSEQLHRATGRIERKLDGIAEALATRNARDEIPAGEAAVTLAFTGAAVAMYT
jgi:hypothetical protein